VRLKVKGIARRKKKNPEALLENTKNMFNDVVCLSVTKVKELFCIYWTVGVFLK
jgi:hypothetical protein